MTKKKSKIISKSTVKLKGKDGGNFTEKLKSKSYISTENSASKLKQSLKNEKAKSSIKSVKKNIQTELILFLKEKMEVLLLKKK